MLVCINSISVVCGANLVEGFLKSALSLACMCVVVSELIIMKNCEMKTGTWFNDKYVYV